VWAFLAELVETFEDDAVRKGDVSGDRDLGLPARGDLPRDALDAPRVVEQHTGAAIEKLTGGREHGLAADDSNASTPSECWSFCTR
jgi:hypothetical protein